MLLLHNSGTRTSGGKAKGFQENLFLGAPSRLTGVGMERRAIFLLIFSTVFALALFAFWRGNIPIAAQGSLLDGKTFVGEFGKKGEKAEDSDELLTSADNR